MKNLIAIFAVLVFTTSNLSASTTPMKIISTDEVEVVLVDNLDIFSSAEFNKDSENLEFTTNDQISLIQIFDSEGNIEFQLPVMSTDVKINKNLFNAGTSKVGFILSGQNQVHFTEITIK